MASENIILLAAGNNKLSEKPCVLWSLANGRSILKILTMGLNESRACYEDYTAIFYSS